MQNVIVWSIPTIVYYNNYSATSYTQQIRVEQKLNCLRPRPSCYAFRLRWPRGLMSLGTKQSNNLAGLWGRQPVGCVNY